MINAKWYPEGQAPVVFDKATGIGVFVLPHRRMRPVEVVWRREPDYKANHEKRQLIREIREDWAMEMRT